ncbi:MAG: DNA topoisomerase III [Oscillospiraceae bacterium]|jgi:DNA topoisomerase-3|nr:DNA topoisomerase III [Oscillospiraceae bacterium]
MGKSLVLAEKPSVAKEIARVLGCRQNGEGCMVGERYIVTWALGHLVTLADPEIYNKELKTWSLESLPMLPAKMQLVIIKETSKQYNTVQSLLKRNDVTDIVIATDAGREGELVARWILAKAGCNKPAKRLWISSQTDKAVREGFQNLKPAGDYFNLFLSAEARAEADWLVGLNVTRALTCKHNASLSAGRVQTPTLAMIVAREREIKSFVPKEYYTIKAQFGGFSAVWTGSGGKSRLFSKEEADAVLQRVSGKQGVVTELQKQYKHSPPPAAYDLTELQRDANRKFAYSAKETLSIMQSLYERHKLLTYPRTDSRYITDDIVPTLPDRLRSVAIGPYRELAMPILKARPLSTKYIADNNKVSDHHAIIPTDEPVELTFLTPEERNVYDLVVRRFLAVLMPAFEYEETKLTVTIGKERFSAKGKMIRAAGWKAAYGQMIVDTDGEGDDDSDIQEQSLPQLQQGSRLDIQSCNIVTGKTKPPARYNEATLLTAMENPGGKEMSGEMRAILKTTSGLGTPATRADIIEKLFSSFYVERRGKEIVPTSKGMQLVELAPDDLRSAELTARWEQELSLIAKGMAKKNNFITQMRDYASSLVTAVAASEAKYTHDNITREKCPDCGKFLLDVNGKKGKMLICPDRECGYRKSVVVQTNARCPNCHKKMDMRGEGEKRLFVCICGYRERLADFEKRRTESGASKRDVQNYLQSQNNQNDTAGNSDLAAQLAKWMDQQD